MTFLFINLSSLMRTMKTEFPITISRASKNGRLNFELIEGVVRLLLEILKLIMDSDVEWFTIEKGEQG